MNLCDILLIIVFALGAMLFMSILLYNPQMQRKHGGVPKVSRSSNGPRYIKKLPPSKISDKSVVKIWDRTDLQPNDVLRDMYRTQSVIGRDGKKIKFTSGISSKEGWHLYQLIILNKFKRVVEVGCANGTSALYMCQALHDEDGDGDRDGDGGGDGNQTKLISIDPFQSTQWHDAGRVNIEKADLTDYHSVMEMGSDLALPQLASQGTDEKSASRNQDAKFDMAFVDGMHLFDYTLLDIFYCCKLLKIGGVLVVDDVRHPGVKKAIEYIKANYPHMTYISDDVSADTMGTFYKINEDTRAWNFHQDF